DDHHVAVREQLEVDAEASPAGGRAPKPADRLGMDDARRSGGRMVERADADRRRDRPARGADESAQNPQDLGHLRTFISLPEECQAYVKRRLRAAFAA